MTASWCAGHVKMKSKFIWLKYLKQLQWPYIFCKENVWKMYFEHFVKVKSNNWEICMNKCTTIIYNTMPLPWFRHTRCSYHHHGLPTLFGRHQTLVYLVLHLHLVSKFLNSKYINTIESFNYVYLLIKTYRDLFTKWSY